MKTLNKMTKSLILGLFVLFSTTLMAQSEQQLEVINDAEDARREIVNQNPELMELFEKAEGYAIFPNVGKGAYILGGAAGNGAVYENGTLVGMAELRQLDIGFQLGGKAFSEAIIFQTDEAFEEFKSGDLKLSSDISVVMVDEGVSGDVEFKNGIAVISMPKAGAMAGLSVGGQKFDYKDL
ncbi:lipid-binding SYLF domain-containing protein [Psychroflexus sediminis]|uniref:Las17-binding protein actin regulator n=1 Tax=Psychroflexus sediminis TaxID=470826 RepID=A0A1G7XFT3_9FLAO|nr:lipid-binding SYLF domain-containing protein [Psychroflexus sediminis]SDG82921.1 Las17-binding protein actin regulator [Psychroflexus sediminis]